MFWGLLIALVLTVAAVVLAFCAKKKEKAGVLSWVVAIAGFVLLWIFGARLAGNIVGRSHAVQLRDGISSNLSELATNNLSSDVASFVEGYGLADAASEMVAGEAVHYYTVRMWVDVAIIIVVFVADLLLFVAFMEGRGSSRGSRATERHGGSGRNPKYHSRRR